MNKCAGKDHYQEKQKQNHKKNLSCFMFLVVCFCLCYACICRYRWSGCSLYSPMLPSGIFKSEMHSHLVQVSCLCANSNMCNYRLRSCSEMLVKYFCLKWLLRTLCAFSYHNAAFSLHKKIPKTKQNTKNQSCCNFSKSCLL